MPFPQKARIIYMKNPLERVICQLRFPPILKIESEVPAQFQESIRRHFPNFVEKSEYKIEMPTGTPGHLPSDTAIQLSPTPNKNYEFSSENGEWIINLTRSFIAFSALKYTRWEEFKERLSIPFQSFINIYSPEYFQRVGLRYIDIVRRSELGLGETNWSELLQPHIVGMLSSPDVSKDIEGYECKNEIKLEDKTSTVRIITSLIQDAETQEICFLIDSDFFTDKKVAINEAIQKLDYFNARGSRLIQWCITEKLHNAMEPEPL